MLSIGLPVPPPLPMIIDRYLDHFQSVTVIQHVYGYWNVLGGIGDFDGGTSVKRSFEYFKVIPVQVPCILILIHIILLHICN